MRFSILGPLQVISDDGAEVRFPQPRQRALLAVLLLHANQTISVSRLAESLQERDGPPSSPGALRTQVWALRKLLAPARRLHTIDVSGYQMEVRPGELDAAEFRRVAGQGRQASRSGDLEVAVRSLGQALALWGEPALADVPETLAMGPVAQRLLDERAAVRELLNEARLSLGEHASLIPELRKSTAADPANEKLWEQLMLALHGAGRNAEALAAYQQARTWLTAELGLEPGHGLQRLHQRILAGDPAPASIRPVDPASLRPSADPGRQAESGPVMSRPPETDVPAASAGVLVPEASGAAGQPMPLVRYSLPPDTAAFTGRAEELAQIMAAGAGRAGGVVAMRAIDGMPGVGKTALAVHAGHLLADRFPDRQLFIDLHAHTPGHDPVRPEDALAGLLTAAGVDPRFVPADLDGRVGMWRDKMAGQRALLVLDNAASSAQVAPLLPGSRDCLVLVTSRRHLGDLPGAVVPVPLGELPGGQAAQMFTRLAPRAALDPAKVAEVVRLAGCLPLAVSLLARVLARHRSWTLADLAADTRAGLLTLTAEHECIAAAFEVSYLHLNPAAQRFFRLLGLHPGATTDAWASAALAGVTPAEAVGLLDGLHGEGLVTETGYRRYGMHDLLRRYARNRAAAHPDDDREQALDRLLDYYQHTAIRAQARLARHTRPGPGPAAPGAPLVGPALDDAGQALAWTRADRDCLLACLDHATRTGQHARITALASGLVELLRRDGPWTEAIIRHATAAQAGRHLGDRLGEANALTDLGDVRRLTGDYPGAARDLEQALALYRHLGDRLGQGNALTGLANVRRQTGDYPAAACVLKQALALYRDLGHRLGQAAVLIQLGDVQRLTGDYPAAAGDLKQALALYRDIGNRLGQATALNCLGVVRQLTGDYLGAARDLEQALATYRDLGSRLGQANALDCLGVVRRLTGDYLGAARDLELALALYRDIGDRDGEAGTLNEIGMLHRASGELAQAEQCHRQALELAHAIASAWHEAHALANLGRCAIAAGRIAQAQDLLQQAHGIFQQIGAADTPAVLAELNALTIMGSAQ